LSIFGAGAASVAFVSFSVSFSGLVFAIAIPFLWLRPPNYSKAAQKESPTLRAGLQGYYKGGNMT
jgi:hypothetical protein